MSLRVWIDRRRRRAAGQRRMPNPVLIALLTILLVAAITYWAFDGRRLPFVHRFTLYALVRNSVDIATASPVRVAGVDVGSVTGTSADGELTKIAFTVGASGRPVHTDATVTIRDRLFLEGSYYLQLDPGSPDAPVAGDGFVIPPSNTSYPVQFYQLLSTFDAATRSSLQHALATLNQGLSAPSQCAPGASTTLTVAENPCPADEHPVQASPTPANAGAGGLKTAISQLTPTLEDVAWVTQGLHGTRPGDVRRLLASASEVTTTLNGSSAQLAELVGGLNRVAGALVATDGALDRSISGLDQTLQAAPPELAAIDHALPPVANLAIALRPSLKAAPPLLDAVTGAVGELAAVVAPSEAGRLLQTLETTFVSFPALLRQLGSVFPIAREITDCLRTHIAPILGGVVPDGSLSSGRPVWQDFVHFIVGLSSAVQNFDGNGYWIRLISVVGNNGLSAGQLPGLGQVLGVSPGTAGIEGARPQWAGDLTSADFRPDVVCSTQPVPSLRAPTVPADIHHVAFAAPPTRATVAHLAKALQLSSGGRR